MEDANSFFERLEGSVFGGKFLFLMILSLPFGTRLASQSGGEDDAEGGR